MNTRKAELERIAMALADLAFDLEIGNDFTMITELYIRAMAKAHARIMDGETPEQFSNRIGKSAVKIKMDDIMADAGPEAKAMMKSVMEQVLRNKFKD